MLLVRIGTEKRPVKIHHGTRSQRIEGSAQVCHSRCNDRGGEQAGKACGQLGDDKRWIDFVRAAEGLRWRVKMIKREQNDPHHEKQRELEKDHEAAGEKRRLALTLVFCGEQPLHNQLVRAVAGAGEKGSADHAGPEEIRLMPVEVEVEDSEFVA